METLDHTYCRAFSQENGGLLDLKQAEDRVGEVQARLGDRPVSIRRAALSSEFENFLKAAGSGRSMQDCLPKDVLLFLGHKDATGKGFTQVHAVECPFVGQLGLHRCGCPRRLGADSIKKLISNLKAIFMVLGRGAGWIEQAVQGNPAASMEVLDYWLGVKDEQAEAHCRHRQAVPMFPDKLLRLVGYLYRELQLPLRPREKFLLLRDRAFFLLQFTLGSRGGDLAKLLIQEVFSEGVEGGLIIRQTYGKVRSEQVSVVRRGAQEDSCPVLALAAYIQGARDLGVDLDTGFVFRMTTPDGRVLPGRISQPAMNKRLELHLRAIGVFEGETTHSLRGGCAIVLRLLHDSEGDARGHIGWKSKTSWDHYSRMHTFQSRAAAGTLARAFCMDEGVKGHWGDFQSLELSKLKTFLSTL